MSYETDNFGSGRNTEQGAGLGNDMNNHFGTADQQGGGTYASQRRDNEFDTTSGFKTGNDANTMSGLGSQGRYADTQGYDADSIPGAGTMGGDRQTDRMAGSGAGTGYGTGGTDLSGSDTGRGEEDYGSGRQDASGSVAGTGNEYGSQSLGQGATTGGTQHKPTMMEKAKGTAEKVMGKASGNPDMAARGGERKVCAGT
ncbi:hypothetical protein OF83DRAFT_660413 [Amylostereum chailletii]|nr:hypothetical protein OF83DRAFT_660413 [Amylostereum chailletii]